jgi:CheY-like chemotaxis protein
MKKVLLVDDDMIFSFLNKKVIGRLDFVNEVDTAQNGKQAIELLNTSVESERALPDIILLDLNMPIMDGFGFLDAFEKLKAPNKDRIKIIVVTSSNNPADIDRAKQYGVSSYLTKPLREEGLLAEISKG